MTEGFLKPNAKTAFFKAILNIKFLCGSGEKGCVRWCGRERMLQLLWQQTEMVDYQKPYVLIFKTFY